VAFLQGTSFAYNPLNKLPRLGKRDVIGPLLAVIGESLNALIDTVMRLA